MVTAQDVANVALECLNTEFHHQGRVPGVGLDCVGVAIYIRKKLGLSDFDITNYGPQPDPKTFRRILRREMIEVGVDDIGIGRLLSMGFPTNQQHIAVMTGPDMMVHALRNQLVAHVHLSDFWMSCVRGVYRFPGVTYG